MKRIIAAIVLVLFISFNICADYNPTQYNVENFDNGENQWDQTGIVDGAWWDHGHPNIYDMRISSNIFYSAPYAFEVKYKERPDDPTDEFFQVDLTQDTANHTDWVNFATGENGLMRIMLRSDRANTKIQFQVATGPVTDYWSKWSNTYQLAQANTWYAIEVNWNNYNNTSSGSNDFNYIRRMNIYIYPPTGVNQGFIHIDNWASLDASIPEQSRPSEIIARLEMLKSYFGTTPISIEQFLNIVLEKTFNYFLNPNAMNLTHGLPRTGYIPDDLSDKGWSNPTEWGYYLNALMIGLEMGYINTTQFQNKVSTSLNTIRTLQLKADQSYHGQFYTYYYVKHSGGGDRFPIHDDQEWLPSIDNAFLAGSLIILREYAYENMFLSIGNLSNTIINDMNFSIYWNAYTKRFSHTFDMQTKDIGATDWDIYANETPYLTLIARALGDINATQLQQNLDSLNYNPGWYSDDEDFSVKIEPCNWDGSLFTYLVPGIHTKANEDSMGTNAAIPAIIAQMLWAKDNSLQYFGWTDIMASDTIEGGAPPSLHRTQIGWEEEIGYFPNIAPYAFFLALNLLSENSDRETLEPLFEICLHKAYQLYLSNVWSNNHNPSIDLGYFIRASVNGEDNSHYFGTLDQFYILGSIFNYLRNVSQSAGNDFRDYFYLDSGVTNAWAEMQLDFKNRLIDNED